MIFTIAFLVLATDPGWKEVSRRDGYTVERRDPGDSKFYEYRVTTETDVSVRALCDGVFEWGSVSKDHEQLKDRRLIEDHGDVRVTYDVIATPSPVATRDLTFTIKRDLKADGSCRVDFFASPEKAPPLPAGWVRCSKLKGAWVFVPREGNTHVTYTLHNDPGGNLPPHLVHGPQRDAALMTVKKGIRLSREGAAGAALNVR